MAVVVIDTIKPKNQGTFPVVEAADVKVTNDKRLDTALNEKANASTVEALSTAVAGKASQSDVTALQTAVAGKASQSDLNNLSTTVSSKASQSDLTALSNTVADKADKSALAETNAAVALKASQIDLNTTNAAVATKASASDLTALEDEVDTKADASDLTTATTNLQNQINNIVSGSTADSEVINARVNADGTSYATLKARCDADDLKHARSETEIDDRVVELDNIFATNNLLALKTKVTNAFFSNGEESSTSYNYYKYIPVENGKTYSFGFTARFVSFFDVSKAYVSNVANVSSYTAAANGYVHVTVAKNVSEKNLKMFENTITSADVYPLGTYKLSRAVDTNIPEETYLRNLSNVGKNKLNPELSATNYILESDGTISGENGYTTSDFIDISSFQNKVCVSPKLRRFIQYDEDKVFISGTFVNETTTNYTVTPENNAKYIKVSYFNANADEMQVEDALECSAFEPFTRYLKPEINALNEQTVEGIERLIEETDIPHETFINNVSTVGKNLLNPETASEGYIIESDGTLSAEPGYDTSDYIDISQFQYKVCVSPKLRKFMQYDSRKEFISGTYVNAVETNYTVTPESNAKYIRVSYYHADSAQMQVEDNTVCTSFEPYNHYLDNEINALNNRTRSDVEQIVKDMATSNYFRGKKWCPCGDSFTDYTNKTYSDGIFNGKDVTYPRIIALRTGISINQNFCKAGRTMAYASDQSISNSFTNPSNDGYYQNIPADTDYITIMLGINDLNHSDKIPLGTINDNTTETYYGAYNTVLTWLRTNRPFAHVGIIITNGTQSEDYTNAQIALAKKYGYPYLNLNGDERTPAMIRPYNPNLDANIKNTIKQIQAIDPESDTHPNYQTHEYESVFIENWLKTL